MSLKYPSALYARSFLPPRFLNPSYAPGYPPVGWLYVLILPVGSLVNASTSYIMLLKCACCILG